MFKKYRAYIKDNPEGYWFKKKLFGWGWTPATWQGWLVTIVYAAVVIALAFSVDESSSVREILFMFALPVLILTALLIRIAHKKGEKPKWHWGFPKEK